MSDHKPRRIIVPLQKSPDGSVTRVDRVHTTAGMLERALGIIDGQLVKLGLKAHAAILDEKESRTLQGYVKSLVELSKEEREREKNDKTADELKGLSTVDMIEMAMKGLTPEEKSELIKMIESVSEPKKS